ncbi:NAD(P)/FAD-dependent oxidoreductase [Thermodesulfobacteriota bacterium]
MSEQHFVIIGNGPSGNQAALTLREKVPDSKITIITKHHGGSYRPNFLPYLISGRIDKDELYIFSPSSYKEKNIKLRTGQEVVDIDFSRRQVILDHKEMIPYTGLIIAVGGTPRIPERLSVFKDLMLTLKTFENAGVWIEKLKDVETILMIGGDLTSLSFTKELLGMGKKVYFVIDEDSFWPIRFNKTIFKQVSEKLAKKGVTVMQHSRIRSMNLLSSGAITVEADHDMIEVDLIGAFFGLVPDIRFLARSGLKIDRGIMVDEYLNTGFDGVYATGDCAQIYHPELFDYWVSIGHDNAVALGETAALNLIGEGIKAQPAECIFDVQGINVNSSWWMDF